MKPQFFKIQVIIPVKNGNRDFYLPIVSNEDLVAKFHSLGCNCLEFSSRKYLAREIEKLLGYTVNPASICIYDMIRIDIRDFEKERPIMLRPDNLHASINSFESYRKISRRINQLIDSYEHEYIA